MAELATLGLLLLAGVVTLLDWRKGFLACIVVGFAQDPLRKLVDTHPGYFVVLVGAVFGFVYLVAWLRNTPLHLRNLYQGDSRMGLAWRVFIALVLLQSLHTLLRHGSVPLAVLGALIYLGPITALLAAYSYADSFARIQKFLKYYVVFGVASGVSVYLSYWFKADWPVLQEIGDFFGKGLKIYDVGTILSSYSGFLRVGEIAAWHAATTVCFLVVLASVRSSLRYRVWVGLLCAVLIGAIVLTGRRKMLMALLVFVSVYWFLVAYLGRGALKIAVVALLVALSAVSMNNTLFTDSGQQLYMQRGASVFEADSLEERWNTVLSLLGSAYYHSGFFGGGSGLATQGARFLDVTGFEHMIGAGEAGIGKIVLELGLLGLMIMLWFLFRMAVYIWRIVKYIQKNNSTLGIVTFGFIAFLIANLATFLVAVQLYGDFFVLLMIGWVTGFIFAMPKILYTHNLAARAAIAPEPGSRGRYG